MKSRIITLIAIIGLLIATTLVSAATINCNLFYAEDITIQTKTIDEGDNIELVISIDNVLSETMNLRLELWEDNQKTKTLFTYDTLNENYWTNYQLTQTDYTNDGTYKIKAFAESTSGAIASDELTLTINPKTFPPTPDTTAPLLNITSPKNGETYSTNQTNCVNSSLWFSLNP
jgi:hypothetical protein